VGIIKKNILFIINPISGGKKKGKIPGLIDRWLDKSMYSPNYSFTESVGHGAAIAEEACQKDFDVIVAVGGDGTINEVASKVMQGNKTLGIIPLGSGNGLARFLKIPLKPEKAIKLLNTGMAVAIDAAKFNERYFFNMAGMGFDAHISSVFANNKTRGLKGYIELGLKEVTSYKPQQYEIEIDGVSYQREAFVISIANSSQYGNNVYVSPQSSITDGLLEICIIKPFPMYKLPVLAYQMISAKTNQSKMVEIIKGKKITIRRDREDAVHLDGEPFTMNKFLEIEILPAKLKVIT
jgi:diacylglycerol kinase (ATP)